MSKIRSSYQWIDLVAAGLLALALAGCSGGGSGGGSGPAVSPPSGGADATALNITITGVTISSPPVVTFTVTDQAGVPTAILAAADLRFNISKLAPGSDGAPSAWQNYINTAVKGAVQGSQEQSAIGFAFGTLINQGNGGYTYTFATDIRNPAANPCPAPCTAEPLCAPRWSVCAKVPVSHPHARGAPSRTRSPREATTGTASRR